MLGKGDFTIAPDRVRPQAHVTLGAGGQAQIGQCGMIGFYSGTNSPRPRCLLLTDKVSCQ